MFFKKKNKTLKYKYQQRDATNDPATPLKRLI